MTRSQTRCIQVYNQLEKCDLDEDQWNVNNDLG